MTQSICRFKATIAVAVCACLMASPQAQADWRAAPPPPGGVSTFTVADALTWLVSPHSAPCCAPTFNLTTNGGTSWTTLQLTGFTFGIAAGAAADGSFRVVGLRSLGGPYELQLYRIGKSEVLEPLGPAFTDVGGSSFSSIYAVSDEGATWIPYPSTEGIFKLKIIAADGSVAAKSLPSDPSVYSWHAMRTTLGVRLSRIDKASVESHSPPSGGGIFLFNAQGDLVPAERYPVGLTDGSYWLSPYERASWDSGAHWAGGRYPTIVPTSPGVSPRLLFWKDVIAQKDSSFLYRGTGLTRPAERAVVDAGSALIGEASDTIYVFEGAPPSLPDRGALPPDGAQMLARANLFRADAGLPPLTGDPTISQASSNHSRYTALNPGKGEDSPGHFEQPGRPGFTGYSPPDRCQAVGTSCNSEVMFGGSDDPVAGWLATPYHRPLVGSPEQGVVGAATAPGGAAIMNGGGAQNVLISPFGYPNGRWRGDDGFSGESPDPVETCKGSGQNISYPVGITVSLYLPTESLSVDQMTVRARKDGRKLPGCLLLDDWEGKVIGHFVLDDPIVPGETYDATAVWRVPVEPLRDGTVLPGTAFTHRWSFVYQPDHPVRRTKASRCGGKRVTKTGTSRRDVIVGTKGRDVIDARAGNDLVKGLGGKDALCGGPGRDKLLGGAGRDVLLGSKGNDFEMGGPAGDKLFGGGGRDRLNGGPGRDRLSGGAGRDRYSSGPGKDRLYGTGDIGH